MIKLHTSHGEITIDLNNEKAPVTTKNFIDYVNSGHFDNTIFHRVINNFMIQGGGFEPGMNQKETRATIENEAANGLKNDAYTVAMARTSDVNSASAQFFINIADNDFLNHTKPTTEGFGYCVFGKVVEGTDVVDKIKEVKTGNKGGHQDVPLDDVIIQKAEEI
ncbi:MAG: peptidylprolyl isomerase [Nitrosomonadaceae bacterium]|mgnify:FL=1|jgi:peptidyl-prolyl cis-trans isomerase B (cyclophilin B)|nr:peptidylprolyl isomerase [Nitrosomonadaceae bacterium]